MTTSDSPFKTDSFLQSLLDSTSEGIWSIGLDGLITFVNQSAIKMFGFTHADELLGRHSHELVHHSHADGSHYPREDCPIYQAFLLKKAVHLEDEVLWRKDGTSFYADYRSVPIWQDGEVAGAVVTFVDNTEKRRAQQELRLNRAQINAEQLRLRHLFEKAPIPLALLEGPEHRFRFANNLYREYFLGAREFSNLTVAELLPDARSQGFVTLLDHVYKTGERFAGNETRFDYPGPSGQTQTVYLNFVYEAVRNVEGQIEGILAVLSDVTEQVNARLKESDARKQTELIAAELAAEKDNVSFERHLFEAIFKKSPAAMALWTGPDLIFSQLNPEYQAIFPGCDLKGRALAEALPEIAEQGFDVMLRNVLETGQTLSGSEVLSRIRPAPGQELVDRYYDFAYIQISDPNGKPYGVYDHAVDVTERVIARRGLEQAKIEAERANETKSAFLANMSHEIRTPLAAIDGFTELVKNDETSPEERHRFLETILKNTKALARIIDDILDLAKVEAGKLETESVQFSLPALIDDVVELLGERVQEKNIFLRSLIPETFPAFICSDPTRIRQILINLLGNAVKFTQQGGVTVTLSIDPAHEPNSAKHKISLAIQDTGIGISPVERERLFQPFMQADNTTTRKFGGTGLGLALSRRLANALGGDVGLVNGEQEVGSTFLFTLLAEIPLANAALPAPVTERTREPVRSAGSELEPRLSGLVVLVADDSTDNQFLVRRMLTKEGAMVDVADNGRLAVQAAMTKGYDVILMDIQMPEMDGYAATRALRGAGYKKPIIALTAHAMQEERDRTRVAGCDSHLTKPLNKNELVRTILALLQRT